MATSLFWFSRVCELEKINHWEFIGPFLRSTLCLSNRPALLLLLSIYSSNSPKHDLNMYLGIRLGSWDKLYRRTNDSNISSRLCPAPDLLVPRRAFFCLLHITFPWPGMISPPLHKDVSSCHPLPSQPSQVAISKADFIPVGLSQLLFFASLTGIGTSYIW